MHIILNKTLQKKVFPQISFFLCGLNDLIPH